MPGKIEEYDAQGNLVLDVPEETEVADNQTVETEVAEVENDDPAATKATDTDTIREMRQRFKDLRAEKIKLQNELEATRRQLPQAQGAPKEPTMEDVGFDSKKYRDAMVEYTRKVVEQEKQKSAEQKEQEEANAAWNASLQAYNTRKATIANFDEAEMAIDATFSPIQKGMIVSAANDAAKMMYEIGMDDNLLSELAKIKDLTKFAAKIGELNARTKKAPITKPESRVDAPSAATAMNNTVDKKLAALRDEADKTGDYTKVNQYKKMLAKGGK